MVVQYILERGEDDFLHKGCYGMVDKKQSNCLDLTPLEQWVEKAYWLFKHIGHVRDDTRTTDETGEEDSSAAAKMLEALLGNGSEYNNRTPHMDLQACMRIFTPKEELIRKTFNDF